jgi:LacI family transcriptional regulator
MAASPPKPRRGPASVVDVARLAGVSLATVSRAFNSPERVGPATLERVREAARRLDYLPYGVARSLRRRRSMVVGMVIPSLSNTYFAGTVDRVQALLAQHGYTMLLASSNYDPKAELDSVRAMVAQGVDGLVMLGRPVSPESSALLERLGVPHLRCWVATPGEASVGFDHDRAMHQVARHLVALGHRRFAAVIPFRALRDTGRSRLAAIRDALALDGIALPADCVIDDGGLGIASGREALRAIRTRAPRATAVICSNDHLAAGVILECRALGVSVPGDLSVTGYNDLEIASAFIPSITSVRTPVDAHAAKVAEALLAALASGEAPRSLVLDTEIVARESTAPPAV